VSTPGEHSQITTLAKRRSKRWQSLAEYLMLLFLLSLTFHDVNGFVVSIISSGRRRFLLYLSYVSAVSVVCIYYRLFSH